MRAAGNHRTARTALVLTNLPRLERHVFIAGANNRDLTSG